MAAWFWFAMELGHSFILAGGTASGKTTSLNAISQFIPPEKKIVSIEDTREINLSHENWIAGVTRSGFGGEMRAGKQAGSIDMYKLLEAALRQRPEYLLVGEVRGPEALTLFQAMATGHAVYSTMHADSVASAVYRLENPPINVPRMMLQTLDIVAIQAQVRVGERMARRIREVTEVVGFDPETKELLTNTVFEWDSAADVHRYLGKSYVLEQVMESRHLSEEEVEREWHHRVQVLQWMMDSGVRHVADVARVFSRYYRDPAGLMERVRAAVPATQVAAETPLPLSPPAPLQAAPALATAEEPHPNAPGDHGAS
jgi:flagellar protein FlaI